MSSGPWTLNEDGHPYPFWDLIDPPGPPLWWPFGRDEEDDEA